MYMDKIRDKAITLQKEVGGTIFSFPIDEENPLSHYAIAVFDGFDFKIFPNSLTIEEAAAGILEILEGYRSIGKDDDYDRNVRLVSYDAQINGPSITMRRLRKEPGTFNVKRPTYEKDIDFVDIVDVEGFEEGEKGLSARGLIKFCYLSMVDDKMPKAKEFMDGYYKILSINRYGKTAAAIKQEVRKMDKNQAIDWIEKTFKRYINDQYEIFELMSNFKKSPTSRQED